MTAFPVRVVSRTSVALGTTAIAIQAVWYGAVYVPAPVAIGGFLAAAAAVLWGLDIGLRLHGPSGRHHKPRARADGSVRPAEGTALVSADPAPGAVPSHPRYGDLHDTPPGGITVPVGDHGIRVGGDRPSWVTYIPGEYPYPAEWDTSTDSTRRLYDALRELPEVRP